jgi:hypothetical protein
VAVVEAVVEQVELAAAELEAPVAEEQQAQLTLAAVAAVEVAHLLQAQAVLDT